MMKMPNKKINPTGDKPVLVFKMLFTIGLFKSFSRSLRSRKNAASTLTQQNIPAKIF
jgi:hypothetical protein